MWADNDGAPLRHIGRSPWASEFLEHDVVFGHDLLATASRPIHTRFEQSRCMGERDSCAPCSASARARSRADRTLAVPPASRPPLVAVKKSRKPSNAGCSATGCSPLQRGQEIFLQMRSQSARASFCLAPTRRRRGRGTAGQRGLGVPRPPVRNLTGARDGNASGRRPVRRLSSAAAPLEPADAPPPHFRGHPGQAARHTRPRLRRYHDAYRS